MYNEFSIWLTNLDAFKLGMTFGCFLGVLLFFIITAVVEYAVDLVHKKYKGDKHDKQS